MPSRLESSPTVALDHSKVKTRHMAINLGGAPLNIANGIREFAIASPNQIAIIDGAR